MKARVKLVEGMTWMGEADSGHGVVMDAAPEVGGRNLGTRPMELVLIGLGGCTGIDVKMILQKSRQNLTDCQIEISAVRASEDPKVFTKINVHYILVGTNLDETKVKRAIDLSAEKYCSVSKMIDKTAEITHSFEIKNL
jgi:putative redox protein